MHDLMFYSVYFFFFFIKFYLGLSIARILILKIEKSQSRRIFSFGLCRLETIAVLFIRIFCGIGVGIGIGIGIQRFLNFFESNYYC